MVLLPIHIIPSAVSCILPCISSPSDEAFLTLILSMIFQHTDYTTHASNWSGSRQNENMKFWFILNWSEIFTGQISFFAGYGAIKGQVLNAGDLEALYSGLKTNDINHYSHLLTGRDL